MLDTAWLILLWSCTIDVLFNKFSFSHTCFVEVELKDFGTK